MKGTSFLYRAEHVLQLGAVAAGAALGAAAASYFLDPELGHVRRARLREELASRASAELWELNRASARWACEGLDRLSAELRSRSGLLYQERTATEAAAGSQSSNATILTLRRTGS
jgi:hypothetical protein